MPVLVDPNAKAFTPYSPMAMALQSRSAAGARFPGQPTLASMLANSSGSDDPELDSVDAASGYVPEDEIAARIRYADRNFSNLPPARHWTGVLAHGIAGAGSGMMYGSAAEALRKNQELRRKAIQGVDGAADTPTLARMLMRSGDPRLTEMGLKTLVDHRSKGPMTQADLDLKRAQARAANARADYYGTGGSGASGAVERIAERLMEEDPDLSYSQAVSLARRSPADDSVRRENLAQRVATEDPYFYADPEGTLNKWRGTYGIKAGSAPSPSQSPGVSRFAPSQPLSMPGGSSDALSQARDAIAKGAPREKIIERLRGMGIDPSGL